MLQKQDSKQLGAAGAPASGRVPTQLGTLCEMTCSFDCAVLPARLNVGIFEDAIFKLTPLMRSAL